MNLKNPIRNSDATPESQSPAAESGAAAAAAVVGELIGSLKQQKLYREVTLALRSGLRDARAEFSFLRVRGLRCLLKFLRSFADKLIPLLSAVVPVLFQYSLKEVEEDIVANLDHIFTVEPMKLTSASTDTEVALALRVLEGCCLLHRQSTVLAHQHKAMPILLNVLSTRGVLEQGACLDALIALMLDSTANQMCDISFDHIRDEPNYLCVKVGIRNASNIAIGLENNIYNVGVYMGGEFLGSGLENRETDTGESFDFESCNGIEEVAAIIRDKQVDETLRLRCGEFLLLLIGHVDARETPMATVHDDIRRLLGEKSASLIWAASQFGSTLDPEERMTALHIQARRVLESLDLF
ncbi:hypothetical protein V2J09_002039 [Rumex salicifolius]